jgi:hypothetical protein
MRRAVVVSGNLVALVCAMAAVASCEKHRGIVPPADGSSMDRVAADGVTEGGDGSLGADGTGPAPADGSDATDRPDATGRADAADGHTTTDAPGPDATYVCGDGTKDPSEECDQGAANRADAYGPGLCTTACKIAPYCGDNVRNGTEVCDSGGSGVTDIGSCNPECTGYYVKKLGQRTTQIFTSNLGGTAGADTKCMNELGAGWKALLVGGIRRATVTPFLGDGQQDWVIQKYTHYYNTQDQLVWRTDDIPLLGVRSGARVPLNATFFADTGMYPWSGYAANWTTLPDIGITGTCIGWMSTSTGYGSFVMSDLATTGSVPCGQPSFVLCIQQ